MISEQQRRVYLQAMGIEVLLPRLQLPGAKLSELGEPDPVAEVPASVPAAPARPSQDAAAATATVKDLLGELETRSKPAAVPVSGVSAPRRAAETQATPRFSLSVIRAGRFVLIDEGMHRGVDPALYQSLLKNVLFAVGGGPLEPVVDAFIWPLSKLRGGRVDHSESAAREVLQAYIGKQAQLSSAQYLVVMGGTAARYAHCPAGADNTLVYDDKLALNILQTSSALLALADPGAKALLWRQLQPLVNALRAAE